MSEEHEEHVGGKGFAPTESNVDDPDTDGDTVTHGGGKQFAKDVGDPEHDQTARQTEGSGKQFAWDRHANNVPRDDDADRDEARGSGTQFEPGDPAD